MTEIPVVESSAPGRDREANSVVFDIDDLDVYYRDCVIGGPGAFVVPVLGWEDFADAVLQKLVMEVFIGSIPPAEQIIPVQYNEGNSYDCLIGEKIWQNRSRMWEN